jgi:hypothetical protein
MPSFKKRCKINKKKFTKRNRKYSKRKKMIGGLKVLQDVSNVMKKNIPIPSNFVLNDNTCSIASGMGRNLLHLNSVKVTCNPQSNQVLDELETAYDLSTKSFTDYDINLKMSDLERVSNIHSYTGDVENNMLHGDGKVILKNGCMFVGAFNNDALVYGVVTYTPPRPAVYGELVVEPIKVKPTKVIFDGKPVKKYVGPIRNGTPHGDGTVFFNDETIYQGPIVDGNIPLQESRSGETAAARTPSMTRGSSAQQKVQQWDPENLTRKSVVRSPPKTELERVKARIKKLEDGLSRIQDDTELIELYRRKNVLAEKEAAEKWP